MRDDYDTPHFATFLGPATKGADVYECDCGEQFEDTFLWWEHVMDVLQDLGRTTA